MHGTLPISEEQALATLRERAPARLNINIAALSRDWGWSRDKVRRRLERWRRTGELPRVTQRRAKAPKQELGAPAIDAAVLETPPLLTASIDSPPLGSILDEAPPEISPAKRSLVPVAEPAAAPGRGRRFGAAMLAFVGVALAGIGMAETTAYAMSVGGFLFAALAVCADALVLLMPAAVAALWQRRSPAAIVAAALWLIGGAVTIANLSGYVGGSDDHFRAGRETQSVERTLALEQLARLRHERDAIAEIRPAAALRLALRDARRANRPALRLALAMATRRDAIESELSSLGASLPAVPAVATADPSASILSELTGLAVTELTVRRLRLALLLALPLCGGFVLSIALCLLLHKPMARRRRDATPAAA